MKAIDFDRAIGEGLAVYYFPGMWEWNREIVRPLALEGFFKSMREQRAAYIEHTAFSEEQERQWNHQLETGEEILRRYFDWAPQIDRFCPIRVETQFEVNIPDPWQPQRDLMVSEGVPLRYRGRINLLVVDGRDSYWLVNHRIVDSEWDELDHLLLDDQGVSYCWAWENFFLGMKIAGTIYNEIRKTPSKAASLSATGSQANEREREPLAEHRRMYAQADREPDQIIKQEGNQYFRRTQIPRSRMELKNFGRQLALEVLDMTSQEVRLYPNPSRENCAACEYIKPCIALNEGASASAILETSFRRGRGEEIEEGRIGGSTWSVDRGAMPPNFGQK